MTKRGFTLIELLVVVAIIAILAAILFPAFARAREAARKATCISNVKQLCLAIQMYSQDYDEYMPSADFDGNDAGFHPYTDYTGSDENDGNNYYMLGDVLKAYTKNDGIYTCPTNAMTLVRNDDGKVQGADNDAAGNGSYFYGCAGHGTLTASDLNGNLSADFAILLSDADTDGDNTSDGALLGGTAGVDCDQLLVCGGKLSQFNNPGNMVAVGCDDWMAHEGYTSDYGYAHFLPAWVGGMSALGITGLPATTYGDLPGGTVFGYADGHAKYWRGSFAKACHDVWGVMRSDD